MAIRKKALIEKRYVLNELRRNNMTLQEMRFFSIYLSKINPRDISTRAVRFPLEDFRKIMELGRMNMQHFQAVTNSLLGKVVNVPDERGGYIGFQLFKRCRVSKDEYGQWYVEIDAHDEALPLMFDFKRDYFTYELWNALRLKSGNQLRMYELLKQYEKLGSRKIPLDTLKHLLGIGPDEYPRWDNFKKRVLDSCQEALAENTDICFDYEPIKAGRKITGVLFTIRKNEAYVDQMTLDEFIDLQGEKLGNEPGIIDAEGTPCDDGFQLLQDATGNEFTEDQITEILQRFAAAPDLPDVKNLGQELTRYHWLAQLYAKLNTAANRAAQRGKPIRDRYKYFLKLLDESLSSL